MTETYESDSQPGALRKLASLAFDGDIQRANIADALDDTELSRLGARVARDFADDKTSRSEYEDVSAIGLKLAEQVISKKSYPFEGAANVKIPIIPEACIQFAARAAPELLKGPNIVKGRAIGYDPDNMKADRAQRVSQYMSWQVADQMDNWLPDMDRLLHLLPVYGSVYKKVYWSPAAQRVKSEYCLWTDVVVNNTVRGLSEAPHISQAFKLRQNDFVERSRSGLYLDTKKIVWSKDDDEEKDFIEQHRFWDLDGDGYAEPYCVTIEKDTGHVVRIYANYELSNVVQNQKKEIARIKPNKYFAKYDFIPSLNDKHLSWGFAYLLGPLVDASNSMVNQLLDAGHMSIMGGGFIGSGLNIPGGSMRFKMGEWKVIQAMGEDISKNIFRVPTPEPSAVLFNLLGMVTEYARGLSSVSEAMAGRESASANEPATSLLARLDQGMKVFSSIYQRIYRSMSEEFGMIFDLNGRYLNDAQYQNVLDGVSIPIAKDDFNRDDCDVLPTADPTLSSLMLRMAKSQALLQMGENPEVNQRALASEYISSIGYEEPEKFLADQNSQRQAEAHQQAMAEVSMKLDALQRHADITNTHADTIKKMADADAQAGDLAMIQQQVEMIDGDINETGAPGMEGQQGYESDLGGLDQNAPTPAPMPTDGGIIAGA